MRWSWPEINIISTCPRWVSVRIERFVRELMVSIWLWRFHLIFVEQASVHIKVERLGGSVDTAHNRLVIRAVRFTSCLTVFVSTA